MRRKVVKMKSKAKSIILILITLGIIFALSPTISNYLSFNAGINDKYSENFDNQNLKLSKISGPIYINDINPSNNWSATESTYSWCTGSGTFSDPYVIEDLVIDGGGSGSCIWIQNSDKYFNIENCTLYNSGNNWDDAGIKLATDVDNGQLIDNIIHDNYIGIYLESSDNNIVSGNIMLNNGGGIRLGNTNYTKILNNTIEHSTGEGIAFQGNCTNNWISKNYVNNNTWGIGFGEQCHNNTAIANYVNDSSAIGIEVYGDNQTFLDNIITNNGNGIMITSSNNNISGNTISFNDESGIYLGPDSKNNIIFRNTIEGNLVDNGYDEGTNNQWDNGKIGNYWSDYPGVDANDDGIGDTPYNITGTASSQDNFPIWDDGPEFKIPGYNLFLLLGILSVVSITLSKKLKKY